MEETIVGIGLLAIDASLAYLVIKTRNKLKEAIPKQKIEKIKEIIELKENENKNEEKQIQKIEKINEEINSLEFKSKISFEIKELTKEILELRKIINNHEFEKIGLEKDLSSIIEDLQKIKQGEKKEKTEIAAEITKLQERIEKLEKKILNKKTLETNSFSNKLY